MKPLAASPENAKNVDPDKDRGPRAHTDQKFSDVV